MNSEKRVTPTFGAHHVARAVICFALLAAAAPCRAQLTPEQALDRRQLADVRYSPDGSRVAFTVTEPVHGTAASSNIWVLDTRTREVRRFTASAKSDRSPRWSPDGNTLAFLSNRGEQAQVYLLPTTGGEARPLTNGKNSVGDFAWSPDNKQIGFLAEEPPTEDEQRKEKDKDDARVVDTLDKLRRLWVADVESGAVRQVTRGRWEVSDFDWSPDAKTLYAIATDRPHSDQWFDRLVAISAGDGAIREILAPRGPFGDLHVSRDGTMLSFVGSRVDGPAPHDLYVVSVAGGPARNLTAATLDRPIYDYKWLADGSLLALVETGFTTLYDGVGSVKRHIDFTSCVARFLLTYKNLFFPFDQGSLVNLAVVPKLRDGSTNHLFGHLLPTMILSALKIWVRPRLQLPAQLCNPVFRVGGRSTA